MIKGILFLAIACMIFVAGQRKSNNIIQQNLKSNLIRFHVRANSNSRMDQTYKLKVRDAVIDQISPELSEAKTKEEAFKILKMQKNRIKNTAQEILKKEGVIQKVKVHFVQEKFPEHRLRLVMLHPSDDRLNLQTIRDFFIQYPHVREGITFNSRVFRIVYYLEDLQLSHFRLLGYEPLLPNIKALKEGKIRYLLSQRPELQGYRGMKALCEYKVFKKEVPRRNFMPIDILTAENIDYYTDFQLF